MIDGKRIGLALSGGGFRAAAFHLGVLRKLKNLNILDKIDVISTISGGSITGAYYLLNKNDFNNFSKELYEKLQKSILQKVVLSFRFIFPIASLLALFLVSFIVLNSGWFAFVTLSLFCLIILFFHNIFPASNIIKSVYDDFFFQNKCLKNFPDIPDIVIGATNIETGTPWTFSRRKMGDSSYSYPKGNKKRTKFMNENFPISLAVAASTAVPYAFNPIKIEKKYFKILNGYECIQPKLLDGGIYDNQGIHKITQPNSSYKCDIIICSDGSQPFKEKFSSINPLPVLKRVMDLMMKRIKAMQFIDNVYYKANGKIDEIAYFSLDWQYEKCISGFIGALQNGKLSEKIIEEHKLDSILSQSRQGIHIKEIESYIKEKVDYFSISKNGLNESQIASISEISTSLNGLKKSQIDLLIKHAEILTELQLKLYCPVFFGNHKISS
jgi:NTE family protein